VTEIRQPWAYLAEAAADSPNAPAFITSDQVATYAQFADVAAKFATVLRQRGVRPGDVIALNLPGQLNTLMTWAVFHEAAIVCAYQPFLLEQDSISIRFVVSVRPITGVPADRLVLVDDDFLGKAGATNDVDEPISFGSDEAICRFTFTSGTTGRPKIIAQTVRDVSSKYTRSWSTWYTDGGLFSLFPAADGPGWGVRFAFLQNRLPFVIPEDAAYNIGAIRHTKPRHLRGSARQLTLLAAELESKSMHLADIETVSVVGSQLPSKTAAALRKWTGATRISNSYSATECGIIAKRLDDSTEPNYMGEVVPTATVEIVDPETHVPLESGAVGAIRVRTPNLIDGYYRNAEATATAFRDGWFYPGDLGRLDGTKLYLHGRIDELINSGGVKTDPAWVDDRVMLIDGVVDCATFALQDSGEFPVAATAIVLSREFTDAELRAAVFGDLVEHTPQQWFRVDVIPRTESGKPLRRELSERFAGR
jgi:acyl-coenzyme A synthetase/AMP-(fatty) acid ligase